MRVLRTREAVALSAILALAFVVRLAWVLLVPNEQYSVSVWYDGAAASLAAVALTEAFVRVSRFAHRKPPTAAVLPQRTREGGPRKRLGPGWALSSHAS